MKKQKNTTTLSTCIITPTTTASGTTFRYLHGGRAECDHITKLVLYICCSSCCCCCYRTQIYCKNLIAVRGTSLRAYARLFAWLMHLFAAAFCGTLFLASNGAALVIWRSVGRSRSMFSSFYASYLLHLPFFFYCNYSISRAVFLLLPPVSSHTAHILLSSLCLAAFLIRKVVAVAP